MAPGCAGSRSPPARHAGLVRPGRGHAAARPARATGPSAVEPSLKIRPTTASTASRSGNQCQRVPGTGCRPPRSCARPEPGLSPPSPPMAKARANFSVVRPPRVLWVTAISASMATAGSVSHETNGVRGDRQHRQHADRQPVNKRSLSTRRRLSRFGHGSARVSFEMLCLRCLSASNALQRTRKQSDWGECNGRQYFTGQWGTRRGE